MEWSKYCGLDVASGEPASIKCLEAVYANVLIAIVSLTGLALFIMFLIGGFTYLTSAGDAKKAQKAQQIMFWAVLGAVIMVSAYVVLNAIQMITGVNLLEFQIPS